MLASGILGGGAAAASPPTNAPSIRFASTVWDFGTVMAGDPVEHVFNFTNAGAGPLEIIGVYPSCSCTTPGEWTRQVPAGGTGHVALRLDTGRFDGAVSEGAVVASTDRARFNIRLQLKGKVWKPLDISPRLVILKPVMGAAGSNAGKATIVNHLPDPITLGPPESDNAALTAEVKTVVAGREFEVTIRAATPTQSSMAQGRISFKTGSSRAPLAVVPVLVMPQPPAGAVSANH